MILRKKQKKLLKTDHEISNRDDQKMDSSLDETEQLPSSKTFTNEKVQEMIRQLINRNDEYTDTYGSERINRILKPRISKKLRIVDPNKIVLNKNLLYLMPHLNEYTKSK